MRRIAITPRTDWQRTAEAYGFRFHTISGEMYWDESSYYAFSLQEVERDIEDPTGEIHQMAISLVGDILRSETLLTKLAIPSSHWDWIADSWRLGQPHLNGRMAMPTTAPVPPSSTG